MEIDTVLSSSPPSLLVLPDESLNLELATEISAVPVPFVSEECCRARRVVGVCPVGEWPAENTDIGRIEI